jgi:hypothetical protein
LERLRVEVARLEQPRHSFACEQRLSDRVGPVVEHDDEGVIAAELVEPRAPEVPDVGRHRDRGDVHDGVGRGAGWRRRAVGVVAATSPAAGRR